MKTSESLAPYKIKEILAFHQAWWYVSIIPELGNGRQEDQECKVILSYTENSRPTQKKRRMERWRSSKAMLALKVKKGNGDIHTKIDGTKHQKE